MTESGRVTDLRLRITFVLRARGATNRRRCREFSALREAIQADPAKWLG